MVIATLSVSRWTKAGISWLREKFSVLSCWAPGNAWCIGQGQGHGERVHQLAGHADTPLTYLPGQHPSATNGYPTARGCIQLVILNDP